MRIIRVLLKSQARLDWKQLLRIIMCWILVRCAPALLSTDETDPLRKAVPYVQCAHYAGIYLDVNSPPLSSSRQALVPSPLFKTADTVA